MKRALLVLLLVVPLLAPTASAETDAERAQRALATLAPETVTPAYLVEALSAAGIDARAWPSPERNAFDAMRPDLRDDPATYKSALRIAYAVGASGRDARDFHGIDLVAHALAGFDGTQFGETATINDDIWALLALRAAGVPASEAVIVQASATLAAAQAPDGGWGWNIVQSETDITGMAIVALRSAGHDVASNARASAYLASMRDANGGYKRVASEARNVQSTVWALHALAAMGTSDPASEAWLRAQQKESGAFPSVAKPKGDPWTTVEAALYLAGGRHPLLGYHDPGLETEPSFPGAPTRLRVSELFDRVEWTIGGRRHEGRAIEHAFPTWGEHAFSFHAVGEAGHARVDATLVVPSAPPVARLAAARIETDRHALVRPDLAGSSDADGRVVRARVDWGDGAASEGALDALGHAYELPGKRVAVVAVQDDAGVWSAPVELRVLVRDRAPRLALPDRLVADRTAALVVPVVASDPDGDPVALTWSVDGQAGEGRPGLHFGTLGPRILRVVATDPYGLATEAAATVEVVNLPPEILSAEARVAADGVVELVAAAADADGPTPASRWTVDGAPVETTRLPLAPGAHSAEVVATDADGDTASRAIAFVVGEPRAVARVHRLEVAHDGADVLVDYEVAPEGARVRIEWPGGSIEPTASPARIPSLDAPEMVLRLVATWEGTEASVSRTVLRRDATAAPPPLLLEASTGRAWTGETVLWQAVAHGAVAYRFDLGDGNATEWASDPRAPHAYTRPGLYAVVAQARSATGAVASASGTVLIESASASASARTTTTTTTPPEPPRSR